MQLAILDASTPGEIEAAFAMLIGQRIGALVVGTDFANQLDQIVALAARNSIPAIYSSRSAVEAGGLMSYSAQLDEIAHVAGSYVGRILRREKPANLPVQQATKTELTINAKTAKALGIEVPRALLVRADKVIE